MNPTAMGGGPARVLVVDDLEASRFIASSWLRRSGHTVVEATTAAEALTALETESFDLVLLDVHLPDMSGYDVTERIKADPRTSSIPVVMLSATYIEPEDKVTGLLRGADAYLTEPVDPGELLANVEAALRYHRARALAEHLAARLTRLTTATFAINAAMTFDALAEAAAIGAADVLDADATAALVSPSGVVCLATANARQANRPRPDIGEVERWMSLLNPGVGVTVVEEVPWARVTAALARTKPRRSPICIAVAPESVTSDGDRNLLRQLAQATALAAEGLHTFAEEHSLALTLQRSLLPRTLPHEPELPMTARYVPASSNAEIGGDFYDVIELDGRMLIAIGDVCGHSIEAATIMAEVRHTLRAYAVEGHRPAEILRRVDTLLERFHPTGGLTTMCLLLVDLEAGTMAVANAGHVPPLVIDDRGARYAEVKGPLLGVGLDRPEATELPLPRGTTVLLATDGLVERRGIDLDEGMEKLRAAVSHTDDMDELADRLLAELGQGKQDDIALLLLRRRA
ncbi:Response regulator receiver domain-containing protein [Lentzea xinjiangensis]|uniref:Response regulator receiver domain-containing protein n=1 Tax=Lentzea xinjiangensis TaxID=402600 RepID=A0A1H9JWE2_9PSEU|nr:fused response regulator/phosphatase [Lentzea xinjiangensis]SEQ91053.1 Response regulator receiver domain-containing protein [Lentzea xinjiangensis]